MRLLIIAVVMLVGCSSAQVTPHDPLANCEYIEQDRNMPDITDWSIFGTKRKEVDVGRVFKWLFLHDPARPDVLTAAIVVGTLPLEKDHPTRFSWQVGDTIRTVRPATDEMICVKPIITMNTKDGPVRLDLNHLRFKILALP